MIPPWIKNPSPASNTSLSKQTEEEIPAEDHLVSSQNALRASDFFSESQATMESFREESISDDDDSSAPPFPVSSTPTSPLQRSESSRSATNILDGEAEPVWLRDLKVFTLFLFSLFKANSSMVNNCCRETSLVYLFTFKM